MTEPARSLQHWDLYCQVVDNYGDAGVLWRLARRLAAGGGRRVRLLIDRPGTLARLVPGAAPGVSIDGVRIDDWHAIATSRLPDVLVTGFACVPPPAVRHRMRPGTPLWITVEHLSAEPWVERFHGSPSPKTDGCVEHYFYPGFVPGTGGLLIEPGVLDARDAALSRPPRNRIRLLAFCYPHSPLALLLRGCQHEAAASGRQWEVVVPSPVVAVERTRPVAPGVRLTRAPFVPQAAFDEVLRRADINFVRGEDSWVRALWAARPCVWQAWRQARETRDDKLAAFLSRQAAWLEPDDASALAWLARWWNDLAPTPTAAEIAQALARVVGAAPRLQRGLQEWGNDLARNELATALIRFAAERARGPLY